MRIPLLRCSAVLALGLTLALAACGNASGGADMSSTVDLSSAGGHDLAKGTASDGGLLPLAAACTTGSQCASGVCAPYKQGTEMLCTFACTAGMPAAQCTAPGVGQCNGMGYCKFPGM